MSSRVQIAWRWKVTNAPAGVPIRWQFVAHGAAWDKQEAAAMLDKLREQGKLAKALPLPSGRRAGA